MFRKIFENVKENKPLVHNITNYVTVNDVANAILACGGSPIMSDEPEDVYDITSIASALNINIGTLNKESIKAMFIAGRRANELGHPVILDAVGAGSSKLRTDTALKIMRELKPAVVKGNISEIKALALGSGTTKGVDADISDAVTEKNLRESIEFIKKFSRDYGTITVVTGATDLVTDGDKCFIIKNGRPEMSRITGVGCMLSGLMAAFAGANPKNAFKSAAASVCMMGLAGEIAYDMLGSDEGNLTYRNKIIDTLSLMTGENLEEGAKYELR